MYHCMLKLNIQGDKSYKLDYHTSKFSNFQLNSEFLYIINAFKLQMTSLVL